MLQISIVILVRSNHDELKIISNPPICKQIPGRFEFQFTNEHASKVTFLLFPGRGILCYPFHFSIKSILLEP